MKFLSPDHPFIVAIREVNLTRVKEFIAEDRSLVDIQVRGGVGLTGNHGKEFTAEETDEYAGPLHFAAFHGHSELEQLLIDSGADLDAASNFGGSQRTPITLACWEGDPKTILHAAKAAGMKLDLQPGLFTILAHGGNADLLIEHGAKHDVYTAAMAGDLDVLQRLINEQPESFDAPRAECGQTPLELALTVGKLKSAELLAASGAKVSTQSAAAMGRIDDVKAALAQDKEAATRMFGKCPLLCWAIMGGQVEMVKFLLENGADPEGADEWDVTPLRYSTQVKGDNGVAIVDCLFAADADIDRVSRGYTPIQSALHNENKHVHHRLIYHNENNVEVSELEAKFWQAVHDGDLGTVKSSLKEDSTLASKRFPTHNRIFYCTDVFPLHAAAQNGHWEIAQLLLDHGADPDAKRDLEEIGGEHREFGMPLYFAVEAKNYDFANILLDLGASPMGHPYCDQAVIERMFYQVREAELPIRVMRRAYSAYLPDQEELESQTVAELVGDETDDSVKLFARLVDFGAQPPFTALVREGYHDLAIEIVDHSRDKDGTPHDHPNSTAINNITGAARWYGYPGLFRRLMNHPTYRYRYEDTITTIDVAIRSHNRDGSYADYRQIIVMQLEALKANGDLEKAQQAANVKPLYQMATDFTWGNNYGYRAAIAKPECFIDLAELFVSWGFDDIEYRDPNSNHSPLSAAVERGSPGIATYVRWLVQRGADLRKSDPDEVNPLAIATKKGYEDVREILLNEGNPQ